MNSKRRIVVVDDNIDSTDVLGVLLEILGHEVHLAHTGTAAIAAVREHRPDVLFLDLSLPDMSGFEVARQLRQDAGLSGLRIIGLTGFGDEEHRRRAAECGIDDYAVKPVEAEKLSELLK
jgi:CheY-like chemotaxis protein